MTGAAGNDDVMHKDIVEDSAATYDKKGASNAASALGDAKAGAMVTGVSQLTQRTTTMPGTTTRLRTATTSTTTMPFTTMCSKQRHDWADNSATRATTSA